MSKLNTFGKRNLWDIIEMVTMLLGAVFLAAVFAYGAYQGQWGFCAFLVFVCYFAYAAYKVLSSRGPWTADNWAAVCVHAGNCFLILGVAMFTYEEQAGIRMLPFVAAIVSNLGSWILTQMYLEMLNHPSLMNWNNGSNFDQLVEFKKKNNLELVERLEGNDKLFERNGAIWIWREKTYTAQEVAFRWDDGFLVKK